MEGIVFGEFHKHTPGQLATFTILFRVALVGMAICIILPCFPGCPYRLRLRRRFRLWLLGMRVLWLSDRIYICSVLITRSLWSPYLLGPPWSWSHLFLGGVLRWFLLELFYSCPTLTSTCVRSRMVWFSTSGWCSCSQIAPPHNHAIFCAPLWNHDWVSLWWLLIFQSLLGHICACPLVRRIIFHCWCPDGRIWESWKKVLMLVGKKIGWGIQCACIGFQ